MRLGEGWMLVFVAGRKAPLVREATGRQRVFGFGWGGLRLLVALLVVYFEGYWRRPLGCKKSELGLDARL